MLLALLLSLLSGPQHGVIVPVPAGPVSSVALYYSISGQPWLPMGSIFVTDELEVRFDVAKRFPTPFPQGVVVQFYATASNAGGVSGPSEVLPVLYDGGVWFCSDEFWSPSGGWCHQ